MPVPWITVGSLVLSNLDKIMAVVKPAFTRKKIDAPANQPDLLNQQIAELQAAAAANAEQIAISRRSSRMSWRRSISTPPRPPRSRPHAASFVCGPGIFGRRARRGDRGRDS